MTQSDKGLAKIAEGASPRRHAETSPVKVKDTHPMNNKLPPAEILCGECHRRNRQKSKYYNSSKTGVNSFTLGHLLHGR